MNFLKNYKPTDLSLWKGRIDSTTDRSLMRWHQQVQVIDLKTNVIPTLGESEKGVAIIGYACQEGVRRNKGRLGAEGGPVALRKAMTSFPVHFDANATLVDLGDIFCKGKDLETTQEALSELCALALAKGFAPIILGGGHDIAYAHFNGIRKANPEEKVGIINFDAHFDLRQPDAETGTSSGTPFWQIAQEEKERGNDFNYLVLAVQRNSNTKSLFDTAEELGVEYIYGDSFHVENRKMIMHKIQKYIDRMDKIYLTTCLDVFASAFAPGVSATAYNGLIPDPFYKSILKMILTSGKVVSMDIAELNPELDTDNRTAKLASSIVFEYVEEKL